MLTSIMYNAHSFAALKKDRERRKTAVEGGRKAGYFRKKD